MKLNEKLYQLRKKKGITQAELSEELGVSRQSISNWEVGTVIPTTKRLKDLSRLYDVPLNYLLDENDYTEEEYRAVSKQHEYVTADLPSAVFPKKFQWKLVVTIAIISLMGLLIIFSIFIAIHSTMKQKKINEEVVLNEMNNEKVDVSSRNDFDFFN